MRRRRFSALVGVSVSGPFCPRPICANPGSNKWCRDQDRSAERRLFSSFSSLTFFSPSRVCRLLPLTAAMSGRGSIFLESPSGEYDDGEVSFRLPPPVRASSSARGGLQLPIRRRRGPVVMVEPEELQTPASFTVARDGTPLAVEVPVAAARSPVGAGAPSPSSASSMSPPSSVPPSSVPSPASHRVSDGAPLAVVEAPAVAVRSLDDTRAPSPESCSSSRRVSSPRRAATIRLGAFDGTSVPLETHLARMRNCSAYYGWSEADRVCHLKASLEGNAASLLWELPADCSEQLLLDRLESRFGDREQIERFRFELKTRRRRKGESIQALHQDVCRLLALSYPGETGSLSKIVARDAFLDSLGDPEMRIRILEKGAASIEEAFSIAARYESYLAGSADLVSSEESGRRRVRAVNSQPDGAASDVSWRRQMEQSVSDLKDGISRLLQQQSCSSQAVGQSSPASSVRRRWRLAVSRRRRVVARHRRGRPDVASRAVLPATSPEAVRSRPGTRLHRFARSRRETIGQRSTYRPSSTRAVKLCTLM
jgi:hypothetical protein